MFILFKGIARLLFCLFSGSNSINFCSLFRKEKEFVEMCSYVLRLGVFNNLMHNRYFYHQYIEEQIGGWRNFKYKFIDSYKVVFI